MCQGDGLITAATESEKDGLEPDLHRGVRSESEASSSTSFEADTLPSAQSGGGRRNKPAVQLLALDMDGTLLDSSSKVLPSSVEAIKAAIAAGTRVCLATGKARPAAVTAMTRVGLAGELLIPELLNSTETLFVTRPMQ